MDTTTVNALGWALIHSLWQGVAIGVLFAVLNVAMRKTGPNARYLVGYAALLAMPFGAIATFIALFQPAGESAATVVQSMPALERISQVTLQVSERPASGGLPYLEIVVWIWAAGVIAMSAWSLGGWVVAQRLNRRSKTELPQVWQSRLADLSRRLGLRRGVRLCESAIAQVPAVIGWLRPLILIPAGALINLSTEELEAVLAHELAHIRRLDYLANLLQRAVETLMFYHPAMWWISRRIRAERENCCDDLAVAACGSRFVYARALTALEQLRCGSPQFAMAATGGPLLSRVRRLLGKDDEHRRALPVWIAIATVIVGVLAVSSGIRLRAQNGSAPSPQAADSPASQPGPAAPRRVSARRVNAKAPVAPASMASEPTPAEIPAPAPFAPAPTPRAAVTPSPEMPEPPGITPVARPIALVAQATPPPAPAPPAKREGYLAGLVDAGYTQVSVDDIISLRDNGVETKYIHGIMKSGFGTPTPKDLINLHNNGVSPEYVRLAVEAKIPNLNVDRIIHLAQNGVHLDNIQRILAMGFGPFTTDQMIELNNNGISADLFEALKDAGFTKIDAHQAVVAQQNGLSPRSLRSLRDQGFKGLT